MTGRAGQGGEMGKPCPVFGINVATLKPVLISGGYVSEVIVIPCSHGGRLKYGPQPASVEWCPDCGAVRHGRGGRWKKPKQPWTGISPQTTPL